MKEYLVKLFADNKEIYETVISAYSEEQAREFAWDELLMLSGTYAESEEIKKIKEGVKYSFLFL